MKLTQEQIDALDQIVSDAEESFDNFDQFLTVEDQKFQRATIELGKSAVIRLIEQNLEQQQ